MLIGLLILSSRSSLSSSPIPINRHQQESGASGGGLTTSQGEGEVKSKSRSPHHHTSPGPEDTYHTNWKSDGIICARAPIKPSTCGRVGKGAWETGHPSHANPRFISHRATLTPCTKAKVIDASLKIVEVENGMRLGVT